MRFVRLSFSGLLLLSITLIAQRGGFGDRDVIPAGSRVEYKTFTSKLIGRDLRYGIYLPASYATSSQKYPVLYFLHGLNENEMRWSTRGHTDLMLDRMVSEKKIGEFIIAAPYGAQSFYTNTRDGREKWEDVIVTEFLPMIESTYRVNATRPTRGISGISMGGYGALKIAMKHPSLFGSVSAHSPALIEDLSTAASVPAGGRRLGMFLGLFDRIYGIGQDYSYWDANNPLVLARDPKKFSGLKIYVDCGTEDEYGFYAGLKALDQLLTKASHPVEAHLYPGNHGWDYAQQHTDESMLFHWKAFNSRN